MLSRFEQFTNAICAIYRDIQKIQRDEMEKYGLRGAFAQYLLVMERHPEGITATRLCEICDKDKAAISRVLTDMENKGLVAKDASGGSLYKALHRLTESGSSAASYVREKATAAVEIASSGLAAADRKVMYDALELIASNIQTICRNGISTTNKETTQCASES